MGIKQVPDAVLEKTGYGLIDFSGNTLDFEQVDLDSYVTIEQGRIGIDTSKSKMSKLNAPAAISFYGMASYTQPVILKDGVICSECSLVGYTNGVYTVKVQGFSMYTIEEGFTGAAGGGSGGGSGGGGGGGGGGKTYQCSDFKDNDLDGKKDYPNDPGCANIKDNSELDVKEIVCVEEWIFN